MDNTDVSKHYSKCKHLYMEKGDQSWGQTLKKYLTAISNTAASPNTIANTNISSQKCIANTSRESA